MKYSLKSARVNMIQVSEIELKNLKEQINHARKPLLIVYVPLAFVFALLALQPYIDVSDVMRDTVSVGHLDFYTGLVSDLGLFVWTAALSICLFSAHILREDTHKRREMNFLTAMAVFILLLLVDDRLLIHEELIPHGEFLYLLYGLGMIYFVFHYQQTILRSRYIYFAAAIGFLGLSVFTDVGVELILRIIRSDTTVKVHKAAGGDSSTSKAMQIEYVLEDGLKLFGIIAWLIYCLSFSLQHLKSPLWNKEDTAVVEQ